MNRLPVEIIYKGQSLTLFTGKNALQEIRLQSTDDLRYFSCLDKEYSYRGQSNCAWPLQTTFERFLSGKVCRIPKERIEQKILEQYRSEFSVFSNELGYDPRTQNTLDALADIQHYGGPTRLLDWTSSFNIALFFAVFKNDEFDATVYCLRNIVFNCATFDIRDLLLGQNIAPGVEESLAPSLDKKLLLHFHVPSRKNNRIICQKGHFIYSGSAERKFTEALSYVLNDTPIQFTANEDSTGDSLKDVLLRSTLIKVIVPRSVIPDVRRYLAHSGISAKTLFPDHFGAIQSLYEVRTDVP